MMLALLFGLAVGVLAVALKRKTHETFKARMAPRR